MALISTNFSTTTLTTSLQKRVNVYTQHMLCDNISDKNSKRFLTKPSPKPGRFFTLPKIHRQRNPGRPLVSNNGYPTLNAFHNSLTIISGSWSKLPIYSSETTHFLNKLKQLGNLADDALLVTLDVSSLYAISFHTMKVSMQVVISSTHVHTTLPLSRPKKLCVLIRMILIMNNFSFYGKHFLQIHGRAIVSKMAPSYANL